MSQDIGLPELELEVIDKAELADGVVSLVLAKPDGTALPRWTPGAHVDLLLASGLERQYSLCGDVDDHGRWRVAVLREPESRGGSSFVHDKLAPGDVVTVRGPRNNFRLEPASSYLFVAGGIGITPILPMIAQAEAEGADWSLLYGGRRRGSMAFLDDLASYGDRVRFWPEDEKGLLPLDDVLDAPREDSLVYCCGPEALLLAAEQRCEAWPGGSLRVERFAPKTLDDPVRASSFRVVCRQSSVTVEIPPDRSILDVVEESGVFVPYSCREGTCGTCETGIVGGRAEHRDCVLTADEQESGDVMMICVSRSLDDEIVLDL